MVKEKENNGITTARVVQEIFAKSCPECEKKLTASNKKQLMYNFDLHHQACKRRQKKQKEKEK